MERLICKGCGAPLTSDGLCEYCGSRYRFERTPELPEPVLVQVYTSPVQRLRVETAISYRATEGMPAELKRDIIQRDLSRKLADGLLDYLKLSVREDPYMEATIVRGEIRVVPPDHRF